LQKGDLPLRLHAFSADDPAARSHPLQVSGLEDTAFVPILNRSFENERHRFESCMRMRLADGTVANIETIVHQQDERIVQGKSSAASTSAAR
jgi:hypothetical protein